MAARAETLLIGAVFAWPFMAHIMSWAGFLNNVADTVAAVGSAEEVSGGRWRKTWAYAGAGIGATALAWTEDTLAVISWTSRAFAFYYLLQCLVALTICPVARRKIWVSLVAIALAFVTIFAIPAG